MSYTEYNIADSMPHEIVPNPVNYEIQFHNKNNKP